MTSQDGFDSDGDDYSLSSKANKGKQKNEAVPFQSFSPAELEKEAYKEIGDVVAILGLEVLIFSQLCNSFTDHSIIASYSINSFASLPLE